MLGALMVTLPLSIYGLIHGRFWLWGLLGVVLGGAFNWGVGL